MRPRIRPALEALEERLVPAVDAWIGSVNAQGQVSDTWSNPQNWSLGAVPQAGDTVLFTHNVRPTVVNGQVVFQGPITYNCHVDVPATVAGITVDSTYGVGGGDLISVDNPLTVTGNLLLQGSDTTFGGNGAMTIDGNGSQWSQVAGQGGMNLLVGTGGLTNNGTLTIDTTNGTDALAGAGTLFNAGIINETGSNILDLLGQDLSGNAVTTSLVNESGAIYNFQSDGSITFHLNGASVTNLGTMEKTGGSATSLINPFDFSNQGAPWRPPPAPSPCPRPTSPVPTRTPAAPSPSPPAPPSSWPAGTPSRLTPGHGRARGWARWSWTRPP
jgi:hypothetical protein